MHTPQEILGDPADGWIRYNDSDTRTLESAYAAMIAAVLSSPSFASTSSSNLVLLAGGRYAVELRTMEQTNRKTGYVRKVQRVTRQQETLSPVAAAPVAMAVATPIVTSDSTDEKIPIARIV